MRDRFPIGAAAALILSVSAVLASCGGGSADPQYPERTVREPAAGTVGAIEGVVAFSGPVPERRRLGLNDAWCGSLGRAIHAEDVLVEDGGLANVLVMIASGLDAWSWDWNREAVAVNQDGCVFIPHVAAVRTRQPIRFLNSDATNHNVNARSSRTGQGFVFSMAPRGDPVTRQFPNEEFMIPVRCDVHANMLMYVHVVDHPCFALSAADGAFRIEGVPAGEYPVRAIHERLGTQELRVTVAAGETTRLAADALVFSE